MIRLVQYKDESGGRRVAVSSEQPGVLIPVQGYDTVYDLARAALEKGVHLEPMVRSLLAPATVDYDTVIHAHRILPPIDHPDPAHTLVSLTGLTHLGSAASRDKMHAAATTEVATLTDSMRMFRLGVENGKPPDKEIGAQPEWAYKGDGRCVVAPDHPLTTPAYAHDGGEEAEIAGIYLIDRMGGPWRIGFVIGNEFADHVLERQNYLYLAHSKLRECSIGPELLVGDLPEHVAGTVRILRGGHEVWRTPFESGEANMCHSIANLEHHHFKYDLFRRPDDVHIHFFGANGVSFGAGIHAAPGDVFEIDVPFFGRPLRNALRAESHTIPVQVKAL